MKKHLLFALVVVGLMGCSEVSNDENQGEGNKPGVKAVCGDGVINGDEKCDIKVASSCLLFDNTKIWESGGVAQCDQCKTLTVGTCKERVLPTGGKCGDGVRNAGEKCDGQDGASCSDYDPKKTWEDGGVAQCQPDCKSLTIGSCKEKQVVVTTCEQQNKITCGGKCVDPCTTGTLNMTTCTCDTTPVSQTCANQGKEECNGNCVDPCTSGTRNPTTCACDTTPVTQTCADQGKEECNGNCVDPCTSGTRNPTTCACDTTPVVTGCKSNADCTDSAKPVCDTASGDCKASTCGDGFVLNGEECDPKDNRQLTCADYDSTRLWKAGGEASCDPTLCKIAQGTCEVDTESHCKEKDKDPYCNPKTFKKTCPELLGYGPYIDDNAPECTELCTVDTSACVVDLCGNGKIDEGEVCDFGRGNDQNHTLITSKQCTEIDAKKYSSGKANCTKRCTVSDEQTECVLSTGNDKTGLYWCQLMAPTSVVFDADKTSETMTVEYGIGNDVTESSMKAELVLGTDFKKISEWISVTAKQDAANDKFTAVLDSQKVTHWGGTQAYYTFRIDAGAGWKYCTSEGSAPIAVADGSSALNTHYVGVASISNTTSGNILAKFDFNDTAKYAGGDPRNGGQGFAADEGTGKLMLDGESASKYKCPSSNCFSGGVTGQCLGFGDCITALEEAVVNGVAVGKHLLIKDVNASGASNINLDMQVKRNDTTKSPKKLLIRYSTNGTDYTEVTKIDLPTTDKQFHAVKTIAIPPGANNCSALSIQIIPYDGGNSLIKFDDIVISKNNED
ncbi:MAG: hypothetical protein IJU23_07835 [Proteobacteria bacterium]|nr:hypothetical protein [Pseudomonadota bacterium]